MRRLGTIVIITMLIPLVPLAVLGLSFEDEVAAWLSARKQLPAAANFALVIGVLAVDIFLPVPSSAVSTYGGGVLGTGWATLASWIGMTTGAVIGFALARGLGGPFARRWSGEADLQQMTKWSARFGPLALVLTRPLPILAEACVLLMGAGGLSWKKFLAPVAAANLIVALVYSAFGEYFRDHDALLTAVVFSGTIPLAIALLLRQRWRRRKTKPQKDGR